MSKLHRSDDPRIQYILNHSLRLNPSQEQLIGITVAHPWGRMLGSADELQLLQLLCRLIGAKKTIDVGVFTGYSAMSIALALPPDGTVLALDTSVEFTDIGRPIWKEAGVADKINLKIAPAVKSLQECLDAGEAGTFDFAFIDADKGNYDNYYEMCLKLLRKGGIIAVDNVLWGGRVADPADNDADTVAIRALNDKIHKDERVDMCMLNVGDGTTICVKQ